MSDLFIFHNYSQNWELLCFGWIFSVGEILVHHCWMQNQKFMWLEKFDIQQFKQLNILNHIHFLLSNLLHLLLQQQQQQKISFTFRF